MNQRPLTAAELDACAQEPIRIPGAIQPHGVLLTFGLADGVVRQVSENSASLLGREPLELLSCPLGEFLDESSQSRLQQTLATLRPDSAATPLELVWQGRKLDALVHQVGDLVIMELEPAPVESSALAFPALQTALTEILQATSRKSLYDAMAQSVSRLTGYERVMVYRFSPDWHGEVVAEKLTAEVDSYDGLRFPASDIPEQARALYTTSWLRIIPNATYQPAALVPPFPPGTSTPLDLSRAGLRSVSPIHLEYLRNMGVGASMSISLIIRGRLWGLIACHHRTPRALPYGWRAACEIFGQAASAAIEAQGERRRLAEYVQAKAIQTDFFDALAKEENHTEALVRYSPRLLNFLDAGGAAICLGGKITLIGHTPTEPQVSALLEWLQQQPMDPLFDTSSLSEVFPPAAEYQAVASGCLAVRLSRVEPQILIWFRPEVVTTVKWAGNPEKPAEIGLRLHPRKSFATWQQQVTGRAREWEETALQGARELRQALNALVVRRSERLLKLNEELQQKNLDLNSFAYIASHDLKEPIRGIYNFTQYLREDISSKIEPDDLRKLDTISALAERTEQLLIALTEYSKLGRLTISRKQTDLQKLVEGVLETLSTRLQEVGMEVRLPQTLPQVECDPVLMREVFSNLLTNAAKYRKAEGPWVEIGMRQPSAGEESRGSVFYVRDNGIGIREQHFENIFKIFRRLHARDKFGGGTGVGLAVVKSIVDRHGGRVWVESEFGQGSTFCFTLR